MIIRTTDSKELISTSQFKHGTFPFEYFNPVQSQFFLTHENQNNHVVAAATSSGKTSVAEIALSYEIRVNKKKGMYLAPFRALSQEKLDDWTSKSHHFSDLKISICTGDYRLTSSRQKELEEADLIVMTSEMLNSIGRNKGEKCKFLNNVSVAVLDEIHMLTMNGRGDHLESGMMKLTEINPDIKLIGLSATMPNVDEIGEWISKLTNRDCYVLSSNYRPVPLYTHYQEYKSVWKYDANEKTKVTEAVRLVRKYSKDKFLLFVHTKRTGELLYLTLQQNGIQCEYHNADLEKEKRNSIESKFKNGNLRCLVATSTVGTGVNLPARRGVILGVHRGISEVDSSDIRQMMGRIGRMGYDPCGDVYILLPDKDFVKQKKRIETPQPILSQMLDQSCLAFHLTSEIHHGNVKTIEDIYKWYERTLAHHQGQGLDDELVQKIVKRLIACGAVTKKGKSYEVLPIGIVASMFYLSPFDVSDLVRSFSTVFEYNKEKDDFWVSMSLGNTNTQRQNIVSAAEKAEMEKFRKQLYMAEKHLSEGNFVEPAVKSGCCYHNLMNGNISLVFTAFSRGLQNDFERIVEVLKTYDSMAAGWNKIEYFDKLRLRVAYGVPEELCGIIRLHGIGKVRAKLLWEAGFKTLEDISDSSNTVKLIKSLNSSKNTIEKLQVNARELLYG